MSGYIRQDTTGAISTGNIIEADDLNAEYNAIEGAFNAATGHTHDGTSAEGAPITVIGPTQDVVATTSVLRPKTNNTVDLGTASLEYKDIHSAGTAFLSTLSVAANATVGGTLSVTGTLTGAAGNFTSLASSGTLSSTGNATVGGTLGVTGMLTASGGVTGALTGNASTATALQTARTLTIGSTGKTFNGTANVSWSLSEIGVGTLGQQNSNSVTITGGTINGTSIGATTASTGAFTTLTATGDVTIPDRIIHAGDTDTQIRFPANDTVTVETNGAERLRVDSSGNVGIGTTIPQGQLHVAPPDNTTTSILVGQTGTNTNRFSRIGFTHYAGTSELPVTGFNFFSDDTRNILNVGGGTTLNNAATEVRVFTASNNTTPFGSERMRIDSAGNVGIGTNSPQAALDIVNGQAIRLSDTVSNSVNKLGRITGRPFDNTHEDFLAFDIRGFSGINEIVYGGLSNVFQAVSTHRFVTSDGPTAGAGSERVRITSTGNVGIGTSSPAEALHVVGQVRVDNSGDPVHFFTAPNTAFASNILVSHSRGTVASPAETLAGDRLCGLLARGHDGTGYTAFSASIEFIADGSGSSGGTHMRFLTAPAGSTSRLERVRVNASGDFLVGKTSTAAGETSNGILAFSNGRLGVTASAPSWFSRTGSNGEVIRFHRGTSTSVGSISVTTTATAYNTSSDYRLKEDVQPMVGASDRVLSLKPCNFAWKVDGSRVDGFLAHEAQAVVPEAVTGEKDGDEMQAMDHSKLVPLLTAALQDALKRIEALEAQLNP